MEIYGDSWRFQAASISCPVDASDSGVPLRKPRHWVWEISGIQNLVNLVRALCSSLRQQKSKQDIDIVYLLDSVGARSTMSTASLNILHLQGVSIVFLLKMLECWTICWGADGESTADHDTGTTLQSLLFVQKITSGGTLEYRIWWTHKLSPYMPLPVQSMSIAVFGFVSPNFGLYSVNVEMFWGLVLLQMTVDLPHNARFITFGHVVTCFLLQYYIVARYVLYIFNNNFI